MEGVKFTAQWNYRLSAPWIRDVKSSNTRQEGASNPFLSSFMACLIRYSNSRESDFIALCCLQRPVKGRYTFPISFLTVCVCVIPHTFEVGEFWNAVVGSANTLIWQLLTPVQRGHWPLTTASFPLLIHLLKAIYGLLSTRYQSGLRIKKDADDINSIRKRMGQKSTNVIIQNYRNWSFSAFGGRLSKVFLKEGVLNFNENIYSPGDWTWPLGRLSSVLNSFTHFPQITDALHPWLYKRTTDVIKVEINLF